MKTIEEMARAYADSNACDLPNEHYQDDVKYKAFLAGAQAVSERELHCFLESKKDFSSWIKDRIERYGFVQGVDIEVFTHIGENSKGIRKPRI